MEHRSVICGMACRVPGANSPSQLWDNLISKKDVQRKVPEDPCRFNIDAWWHPDHANKGTLNQKRAYFIDHPIADFDAGFFGISGKEAVSIDPQGRLLLEVAYEALEDAGISLAEISGTKTAVFQGCLGNDYGTLLCDPGYYPLHSITGIGNAMQANRVSFHFNLKGPSVTVDTACSSSMVCFHLANQSIINGESDYAIVLGSSLYFDPTTAIILADMGFLSSDGRCRAFDRDGSGYVRGEGICAVVLKRQSDAVRDGDRIRAVVRATGSNHDGTKPGLTVPSSEAQESMIRATYDAAGLSPDDTQYFECHGTGTKVGDKNEGRAVGAVFGTPSRREPVVIGSIKSNTGHLEGAAGLAGVIKTVLAIENAQIPPQMHYDNPHPDIKFEEWRLKVPTKVLDWPDTAGGPRRASINSFGYGGANAHAILESMDTKASAIVPSEDLESNSAPRPRPYLLPISSHTAVTAARTRELLKTYLTGHPQPCLRDLAYTLSAHRSAHKIRSFEIGSTVDNVVTDLGIPPKAPKEWRTVRLEDDPPKLGFVFTGQGAQTWDMGRELIETCPSFRDTLAICDNILQSLPDGDRPQWSIVQELLKGKNESLLHDTRYSQPICTALQIAIVKLLDCWGVAPTAVCGHSSGEVAAAFAAGHLSIEAAMVVAYYRGLHMSQPQTGEHPKGGMIAVGVGESAAMLMLDEPRFKGRICLAAVNSSSSVTLSGDLEAIGELFFELKGQGIFARKLQVAQAFHSHHMKPLAPAYEQALESSPLFTSKAERTSNIRMVSSVTSRVVQNSASLSASYWAKNMVQAVRFSDAVTGILLDDDEEPLCDVILEIGPHPVLKGPSDQIASELKLEIGYFATLTRARPGYQCLLEAAGQLFATNYPVNLAAANGGQGQLLTDLPTYAWNHRRYWTPATRAMRNTLNRKHNHTLLGAKVPHSSPHAVTWRNYLRVSELPWLAGHQIEGEVVFPGSGYISLAVEAAARYIWDQKTSDFHTNIAKVILRDVDIRSPMTLRDEEIGTEVLLHISPVKTSAKSYSDDWLQFHISSFDADETYVEHCDGKIRIFRGSGPKAVELDASFPAYPSAEQLRRESTNRPSTDDLYTGLDYRGVQYGENFRLLQGDIDDGSEYSVAKLEFQPRLYATKDLEEHVLVHPALIDAIMHTTWSGSSKGWDWEPDKDGVGVPRSYKQIQISGHLIGRTDKDALQKYTVRVFAERTGFRTIVSQLLMSDEMGRLAVHMEDQESTFLKSDRSTRDKTLFFEQRWEKCGDVPRTESTTSLNSLTVVVSDDPSPSEMLALKEIQSGCANESLAVVKLASLSIDGISTNNIIVLASLSTGMTTHDRFESFRTLSMLEEKTLIWALEGAFMGTTRPSSAQFAGFLRTARNENRLSKLITLDFELEAQPRGEGQYLEALHAALNPELAEEELAVRQGSFFAPRLETDSELNQKLNACEPHRQHLPSPDESPVSLGIETTGSLDTLCFWLNRTLLENPLGPKQLEIEVKAAALNFRDIAIAMGIIQDRHFGEEAAAVVRKVGAEVTDFRVGDRIVVAAGEAIANVANVDAWLARKIPDHISYPVAASFLTVTMTAIYALEHVARLQPGEIVLIHSAAGGVGQMAIQIAQKCGARVFATCSGPKRAFLRETFGLADEDIFSSRDESFRNEILAATGGRGVDVVLNSLSGKLLEATWYCLAPFGRFVEIGKRDIHENAGLPMDVFRRNVSFSSVDMVLVVADGRRDLANRLIDEACTKVFEGELKVPEKLLEFPFSQVEQAFRLMQRGKHIGKIILVPDDGRGDENKVMVKKGYHLGTQLFSADKKYLIVGGLGGLGLKLAEWMFFKGARKLAFFTVSALGPDGKLNRPIAQRTVDWLEERGCEIQILKADVSSLGDVETAFAAMGPVSGIMHLAMVLADVSLHRMNWAQWESVNTVKCTGAWNLHSAAEKHPLDFFTCFSSISTVVGNPGQANYSAANAYLDGLMEWRRGKGLVGTSINIAAVSSIGVAARLGRKFDETISVAELMLLVEEGVMSDRSFGSSARPGDRLGNLLHMRKRHITGISVDALALKGDLAARPLYRLLSAKHTSVSDASTGEAVQLNLAKVLESAASLDERVALLTTKFVEKAAAVMGLDVESIDTASSLTSYGLDSIVAIELRKWMKSNTNVDLPLFELLGGKSIKTLVTNIASRIKTTVNGAADDSHHQNAPSTVHGSASEARTAKTTSTGPAMPHASNGVSTNGTSRDETESLEWWRTHLGHVPKNSPCLPFAKKEAKGNSTSGSWKITHPRTIPHNLTKRMERLCKQDLVPVGRGAGTSGTLGTPTPHYMVLAALWAYTFLSKQEDIVLVMLENQTDGAQGALQAMPLRCSSALVQTSSFGGMVQQASILAAEARLHAMDFKSIQAALGLSNLGRIAIRHRSSDDSGTGSAICEGEETSLGLDLVLEVLGGQDEVITLSLKYASGVVMESDAEQFLDGVFKLLITAVRDHRQLVTELQT